VIGLLKWFNEIAPDPKTKRLLIGLITATLVVLIVLIGLLIHIFHQKDEANAHKSSSPQAEKVKQDKLTAKNTKNYIQLDNLTFNLASTIKINSYDSFNKNIVDIKNGYTLENSGYNGVFYQDLEAGKSTQVTDITTFSYISEDGKRIYYTEPDAFGRMDVVRYDIKTKEKEVILGLTTKDIILDFVEIDENSGIYIISDVTNPKPEIKTFVRSTQLTNYTEAFQNYTKTPGLDALLERDKNNIYLIEDGSIYVWDNEMFKLHSKLPVGYRVDSADVNNGLISVLLVKDQVPYAYVNGKIVPNLKDLYAVRSYDKEHIVTLQKSTLKLVNITTNKFVYLSSKAVNLFVDQGNIYFDEDIATEEDDKEPEKPGSFYVIEKATK
jgi:hypothetical protein